MSRFGSITVREVESSVLEIFYEHQLDPEAIRMAAFVGKDPKDKVAFDARWDKILISSQNITRTIARTATDNIGSIRVLQKCGFRIVGENKDFANGRGEEIEEYILRLDLDQANQ
jgi:hypothetical protein